VVLYEAPHRVARTLRDLVNVCGGSRPVVVARELTKLHEELWRGDLAGALAWAEDREPPGELVLILGGAPAAAPATDADIRAAIEAALAEGLSVRDAASAVAASLGVSRRRAYGLALGVR
jgi:16S rRNA (cytidine1402-2'-O)-methyltransferase